jgi:hypothetical protein
MLFKTIEVDGLNIFYREAFSRLLPILAPRAPCAQFDRDVALR